MSATEEKAWLLARLYDCLCLSDTPAECLIMFRSVCKTATDDQSAPAAQFIPQLDRIIDK